MEAKRPVSSPAIDIRGCLKHASLSRCVLIQCGTVVDFLVCDVRQSPGVGPLVRSEVNNGITLYAQTAANSRHVLAS